MDVRHAHRYERGTVAQGVDSKVRAIAGSQVDKHRCADVPDISSTRHSQSAYSWYLYVQPRPYALPGSQNPLLYNPFFIVHFTLLYNSQVQNVMYPASVFSMQR